MPVFVNREGLLVSEDGVVVDDRPVMVWHPPRTRVHEDPREALHHGVITWRVHDLGALSWLYPTRDPRSRKLAALQAKLRAWSGGPVLDALVELNRLCSALGMSGRECEEACVVLRKLLTRSTGRGIVRAVKCAALLTLASRVPLREAVKRLGMEFGEARACISWAWQAVRRYVPSVRRRAGSVLERLLAALGAPPRAAALARVLLGWLLTRAQGSCPQGVAAAAAYLACRIHDRWNTVTQSRTAYLAGVTEMTLRNVVKKAFPVVVFAMSRGEGRSVVEVWWLGKDYSGLPSAYTVATWRGCLPEEVESRLYPDEGVILVTVKCRA